MGAPERMAKTLADQLHPGEAVIDAIQMMVPGTMSTAAAVGGASTLGVLGSTAVKGVLGGGPGQAGAAGDPTEGLQRVEMGKFHVGDLGFTQHRLVMAGPRGPVLHQAALAGVELDWTDMGRLSMRVRRLRVFWGDGGWSLLELSAGLWRKSRVEEFTSALQHAIASTP